MSVNTTFEIGVSYNTSPGGCSNSNQGYTFTLTIPAGSDSAIADCNSGGVFVGAGQSCGSCITNYYGNTVDTIIISNPPGC